MESVLLVERAISGLLSSLPKDSKTTGLVFWIVNDIY